jgi:Na+-transporting NADH:ubiquinone oxidoreductase subunit NqrF
MMLLMVFVCGGLVGAITMRSGIHDRMHRASGAYWKDDKVAFSYDRLKKDLNLMAAQSDRLKTILDDFVKYNEDLQSQIEDVRATGKNRIVQILSPEQKKRFEELCNQLPTQ